MTHIENCKGNPDLCDRCNDDQTCMRCYGSGGGPDPALKCRSCGGSGRVPIRSDESEWWETDTLTSDERVWGEMCGY